MFLCVQAWVKTAVFFFFFFLLWYLNQYQMQLSIILNSWYLTINTSDNLYILKHLKWLLTYEKMTKQNI